MAMRFTIAQREGYLLAEMHQRETSEETAEFVRGIVAGLAEHGAARLLISVHNSRPIYKVEDWGLSDALTRIARIPGLRIAFIADTKEMRMAQEYIRLLVVQRGIAALNFESEAEALAWLREKA
jgi:hypothetical protein